MWPGSFILYLLVTYVCLRALGIAGLANTTTPASEVMRQALGTRGAKIIACGIALSTVGFLSQSILTAPRVYYAMARDGVFFQAVGRLNPRTRVPVVAIVLQGVWAAVVAMTGRYEQILNYVVTIDVLFFGLTGASLLVFRARARRDGTEQSQGDLVRVPWHPIHDQLVRAGLLGRGHQHAGPVPAKRRDRRRDSWPGSSGLSILGGTAAPGALSSKFQTPIPGNSNSPHPGSLGRLFLELMPWDFFGLWELGFGFFSGPAKRNGGDLAITAVCFS